jgi:hypothetical protein
MVRPRSQTPRATLNGRSDIPGGCIFQRTGSSPEVAIVNDSGLRQRELGRLKIVGSLAGGQVDQVYPKLVFSILFVEEEKPPVPEPHDRALGFVPSGPET